MRNFFRQLAIIFGSILFVAIPFAAHAQADLIINTNGVYLSVPFAGVQVDSTVRIYAKVMNEGDADSIALVEFYVDDALLGTRQVTVVPHETGVAYWDWQTGGVEKKVALSVRVAGQEGGDTNPNNDEVTLYDIWINADNDGDGVYNQKDNCKDVSNPDQADKNKNGVGDACEPKPAPATVTQPSTPAPTPAPTTPEQTATPAQPAPTKAKTPDVAPAPADVAQDQQADTTAAVDEATQTDAEMTQVETTMEPASPADLDTYAADLTIQKEQTDWNAYRFRVSLPIGVNASQYAWSFGDGTEGNGHVVEHTYKRPGTFTVKVTVLDDAGQSISESIQARVGFLNLANWRLWIIIVLLAVIIIVAAVLAGMADAVVPEKEPVSMPAMPDQLPSEAPGSAAASEAPLEALSNDDGGMDSLAATGMSTEALPDELALLESITPGNKPAEAMPEEPASTPTEPVVEMEQAKKAPAKKKSAPKKRAAKTTTKRKPSKSKRQS